LVLDRDEQKAPTARDQQRLIGITNTSPTSLRRTTRPTSFVIALFASLLLMHFPFLLYDIDGMRLYTGLPILMLGVAGILV